MTFRTVKALLCIGSCQEPSSCISGISGASHSEEFEQTEWSDDGRFADVFSCHWDLVVSADQIDFREDDLACQTAGEILDVWDRISVRSGEVVEATVVTAGAREGPFTPSIALVPSRAIGAL